jgi:serine/threonine protein kinase
MHSLATCENSARTVVRFHGYTSFDKYSMARIYMEFCPHGDLKNLLCNHAGYDTANRQFMLDDHGVPIAGDPIPRAVLWSFFEDLAEAACSMAYGYVLVDGNLAPQEDWQIIIHRDLKPENVFLGLLDERGIPVLNFGIDVPEEYYALENPTGMLGAGTSGWKAPEQSIHSRRIEPSHRLSSATNVWSIGRIMLALVELSPRAPPEVDCSQSQEGQVSRSEKHDEHCDFYGENMCNLIDMCIEPQPPTRILAGDLLKRIREDRKLEPPHSEEEVFALGYEADLKWAQE